MFNFKQWKINRLIKKIKAMQANRIHNQPDDVTLKKEINLYYELAERYNKLKTNKKFPYAQLMVIECYRNAAALDNAEAHYRIAHLFIEEGKYRIYLHDQGVFYSQENVNTAKSLFDEAQHHLIAAEKLNHILAKRLRGVSIINGWGVEANKDQGLELVVASIEQEGSWDKVPQIFAEIGLNKPEFFTAIMQRKKGSS